MITGITATETATVTLVAAYPPVPMGVMANWRPHPCSLSTAALPAMDVVAVTAPYAAMDTMRYAETLPWPEDSPDQPWVTPNMTNNAAGRTAMKNMFATSLTWRQKSWSV